MANGKPMTIGDDVHGQFKSEILSVIELFCSQTPYISIFNIRLILEITLNCFTLRIRKNDGNVDYEEERERGMKKKLFQ